MRILVTASILAVLAAAPGVAQAGVFGCDAKGGKQEGGAVIGAIIGGVIGNKLADDNRTAGTVIGAGIGAAIGSSIGCRMQEEDQRKAEAALEETLATGQPVRWKNPRTGAYGEIRVVSYDDGRWYAPNTVNIRARPSAKAPIVGRLMAGEVFEGAEHNAGWLAVEGGYVARSVVQPAAGAGDGCRTLEQTLHTRRYGDERERYRACRKPGGAWEIHKI
ncbi:MAG: glycine zipper 2TM domain-containing protein [Pseudomonadota bacterium]